MSKIYKIINDINDKVYVGKTNSTIEKRFKEHCIDSSRRDEENRPLYRAMNKYGINHFSIHLIEECSEEESSIREQYWIDFYKGYTEGYNATLGGDGKSYIDTTELLELWSLGKSLKEISEITSHDAGWISILLKNNGISSEEILLRGHKNYMKTVEMIDKDSGKIIKIFPSLREAARFLIKEKNLKPSNESGYTTKISEVCRGKRKTCQGYKWRYSHS